MRLITAGGIAVTTLMLLTGTAGAAPANPIEPIGTMHAPCNTSAPDKDNGTWEATARTAARQRSGSSTSCGTNGVAQTTDRLDYHCYTLGNDGYWWTYLRNVRTNVAGWVRDDLLTGGGSYEEC